MEAIPMEWVDKLFNCMEIFYGERWIKNFKDEHIKNFYKTVWKNGLMGLTHDEIKYGLLLCKRNASYELARPPHVMDFFKYAKGEKIPPIYKKSQDFLVNKELAISTMRDIKNKLMY